MINYPLINRLCIIILFLLKFCPVSAGEEGTIISESYLDGEKYWTIENSPYIIKTKTLQIRENSKLVISEGVTVKFEQGATLTVLGSLIVNGSADSPVIFTGNDPEPYPGFYFGISVPNISTGIITIAYAEFQYASLAVNIRPSPDEFKTRSLNHCRFYSNITAISGNALIENCNFIDNQTGIKSIPQSKPVRFSYFEENDIAADECNTTKFEGCTFIRNTIGIKGQDDVSGLSTQTITNCIYSGNDVAISVAAHKMPVIKGSTITGNKVGILIEVDDYKEENSEITDNIICRNDSNVVVRNVAVVGMKNNCWCSGDSSKISKTIYDDRRSGNSGVIYFMPVKNIGCDSSGIITENQLSYSISGTVKAGNTQIISARILLYMAGKIKPVAWTSCESGKFKFKNVKEGVYQIYVIPQPDLYPDYLPTYYVEEISHKYSEFIVADDSVFDVDINLVKCSSGYDRSAKPFSKTFGYKTKNESDINSFYDKAWYKNEKWLSGIDQLPYKQMAKHLTVFLQDSKGNIVNWGLTDHTGTVNFYMPDGDYTYIVERKGYNQAVDTSLVGPDFFLSKGPVNYVPDIDDKEVLKYYPNPSVDFVTLESPENKMITSFEMIDVSGSQVFPAYVKEKNKLIVSVDNLPAGFYVIKYHTEMRSGAIRIFKN